MITTETLPIIFLALMGLAILIYTILDGYDLGVGMLLPFAKKSTQKRDKMIASIGPFWDANETWLVLAIGLLLIAFPKAYGDILGHVYFPVTFMLLGLILRGVAFDFRTKAAIDFQPAWDHGFRIGSFLTAFTQGYILGRYIVGFDTTWPAYVFACMSASGVTAIYCYIGASWLILKTEKSLQKDAIILARWSGRASFLGVGLVSIINPIVNEGVFDRWFDYPLVMFVLLIPTACCALFLLNEFILRRLPLLNDRYCWLPFCHCIGIFFLCFIGIGFSFYPYIIPNELTIWQAASAPESLRFILVGALVVIPCILSYTLFSYWVFRGKTRDLRYY